jgi:hypothetical protein
MVYVKESREFLDLWKKVGPSLCPFAMTQFAASFSKHPDVVHSVAEILHWFAMHGTLWVLVRLGGPPLPPGKRRTRKNAPFLVASVSRRCTACTVLAQRGAVCCIPASLHLELGAVGVRVRIRDTFGVHMLVTGMIAHRFNGSVQLHSAWALGNFALNGKAAASCPVTRP